MAVRKEEVLWPPLHIGVEAHRLLLPRETALQGYDKVLAIGGLPRTRDPKKVAAYWFPACQGAYYGLPRTINFSAEGGSWRNCFIGLYASVPIIRLDISRFCLQSFERP